MTLIPVTRSIAIDSDEIEESFVRASGPGGQHVNTTSTAVQLRFDAARSPSLPYEVAQRLLDLAGSRATQDGVIVIIAQSHRSQLRNREDALARLIELIRAATHRPIIRRATKPTKGSKERRLAAKERRSGVKSLRRSRPED